MAILFGITRGKVLNPQQRTLGLLLVFSYVLALLPFAILIQRQTYLYHYFPALIFSIALASLLISSYMEQHQTIVKRIGLILVIAVIAGFVAVAKYTYGF